MRLLSEITSDGDIIDENGEIRPLFSFDPESLGDDLLE